jgi:hypothetical protein
LINSNKSGLWALTDGGSLEFGLILSELLDLAKEKWRKITWLPQYTEVFAQYLTITGDSVSESTD